MLVLQGTISMSQVRLWQGHPGPSRSPFIGTLFRMFRRFALSDVLSGSLLPTDHNPSSSAGSHVSSAFLS